MFKLQNSKIKMKKISISQLLRKHRSTVVVLVVAAAVLSVGLSVVPRVNADSITDQIRQLQQQNATNRNIVTQLQDQATSFQDAISKLQAQINSVQAQIDQNTAKQTQIQATIVANEQELVRQRGILGESIRVSYVESKISTIEMLATSKNLSDFIDKEEYHTAVKNKIQATLQRINDLQNQLNEQKLQIERLLAEQQAQRTQLANARAEQSKMLAYNQSQQHDYNQLTKNNQAKIDGLIAAQRRANNSTDGGYYFLRFPGTPKDFNINAYKYANAGFSMQLGPCSHTDSYPDSPDEWGYCTRQCVSYAAWAVEASGRDAPMFYGNAKDWVGAAARNGVEVSRTPRPGDVAISTSGTWGHAMYVLEVEPSRILVAQYNANLNGEFSTQWRNY
jgi:peptidoglycan DL-endopeptidase CwlO